MFDLKTFQICYIWKLFKFVLAEIPLWEFGWNCARRVEPEQAQGPGPKPRAQGPGTRAQAPPARLKTQAKGAWALGLCPGPWARGQSPGPWQAGPWARSGSRSECCWGLGLTCRLGWPGGVVKVPKKIKSILLTLITLETESPKELFFSRAWRPLARLWFLVHHLQGDTEH